MDPKINQDKAFKFVIEVEGSKFTDRADDLGGPTKYGISLKNHPDLTREKIMNLTQGQAEAIYGGEYWDKMGCDDLPWPYCLVVFDTAINEGCGGARKLMEHVQETTPVGMSLQLITLRDAFYKREALLVPSQKGNLHGWEDRLILLKKEIGLV